MRVLIQPMPLAEAVKSLADRTPVASAMRTKGWEDVPVALRQRAFFSAGVEHAAFLQTGRSKLISAVSMRREAVANGEAFVDRSSFIGDMRKVVLGARAAGEMQDAGPGVAGGLQDVASRARLGLIYDTQIAQASGFADWKMGQQGLQDYPAQELDPESAARVPRQTWPERFRQAAAAAADSAALAALGRTGRMVALKTSDTWKNLSRFGTPWPPFDFGSKRMLIDVSWGEAVGLGLVEPGGSAPTPQDDNLNDYLEASVTNLDSDMVGFLREAFGAQVEIVGDRAVWTGEAAA